MKALLIIIQTLIILTSNLLCLSEYCKKEKIYDETPPHSCKEILAKYPATPSGYYLIQPPGVNATVKVYCDMENERCGSKGWTRIALVDVAKDKACPGNLRFVESPMPTCRGLGNGIGCASAIFTTHGISYSKVCGRLRGYQVGDPNAFGPYVNNIARPDLIVDGVLISLGKGQDHIWTYAIGMRIIPTTAFQQNRVCPCSSHNFTGVVPPFIGNDYFCDSAVHLGGDRLPGIFHSTPMWTGEGCTPPNFCCSRCGMPWFCKTLPVPTTDYIEIRNCQNEGINNEDTALDLIELYIC